MLCHRCRSVACFQADQGDGYKSPNEKLNIASIGAGGRAAEDINGYYMAE